MIFAAVVALIVILTDRKQRTFKDLHWLTVVVVRYYVAMIMLSYGFSKLHNGQFPANSIDPLEEKIGDMSPSRLFYIYMSTY